VEESEDVGRVIAEMGSGRVDEFGQKPDKEKQLPAPAGKTATCQFSISKHMLSLLATALPAN
jgi:hypothetical protein